MKSTGHNNGLDDLLIKYLSGSADPAEREQVLSWLKADLVNKNYLESLRKVVQVTRISTNKGFNKNEGWTRVKAAYYKNRFSQTQSEFNRTKRNLLIKVAWFAAASVILAFCLGIWVAPEWKVQNFGGNNYNEIIVPFGSRSQITLSDGTKVWLNSGSKFRYPSKFGNTSREVMLDGEAFFDVTYDKSRLFLVRTTGINIKVFGTQFNVKSYPEEKRVFTTLVKGSVMVEPLDNKNSPVYLKPNETAIYYVDKEEFATEEKEKVKVENKAPNIVAHIEIKEKIDPIPITSWKDSKWIIESENLGNFAILLERRYNVKITFDKEELKTYKFSGTLTDETFEQVLRIIQISAPITFKISNNNIQFFEDPVYRKEYDKLIQRKLNN